MCEQQSSICVLLHRVPLIPQKYDKLLVFVCVIGGKNPMASYITGLNPDPLEKN